MLSASVVTALAVLVPLVIVYAYLVNYRMLGPHPFLLDDLPPPETEWDALGDYASVSMEKSFSQKANQRGHVVIGGSGLCGSWIVRLLLMRGERHVRIADVVAPSGFYADELKKYNGKVEYRKTDISDAVSVEEALATPFDDGTRPSVVYHTASIIRFWERLAYLSRFSDRINVDGTRNLLEASKRLGVAAFVYTSTAALSNPKGNFLRLGWGPVKSRKDVIAREDVDGSQDHHYCRTKRIADAMTRQYDGGEGGMRTAVLRPGMTICGPHDVTFGLYLEMAYSKDPPPPVPIFHRHIAQHNINAQDLAAGHILVADALLDPAKVDGVAGEAFMITGDPKFYQFSVLTRMLNHFSRRKVPFATLAPVVLLVVGHLLEAFCYVRYHLLLLLASATPAAKGREVKPVPAWLGPMAGLQPAMFETASTSVFVDDSKIRKTLGYRNQWSMLQTIKWLAEGFERDWDAAHGGDNRRATVAAAASAPPRQDGPGVHAGPEAVAAESLQHILAK